MEVYGLSKCNSEKQFFPFVFFFVLEFLVYFKYHRNIINIISY